MIGEENERFFSAIHIQNRQQLKAEQFSKSFCKYMEKKELTQTNAENSQFAYYLTKKL
jgi:hypothetical protein